MISVAEATDHILALAPTLPRETLPLDQALGRILAAPLCAHVTQPPWDQSAMDGYAVRAADLQDGAVFDVIGEAAAGSRFDGTIGQNQAARIYTGAPVPPGADRVVMQENATRDGDRVRFNDDATKGGANIRKRGSVFTQGDTLIEAGSQLDPRTLALAAAMNHASVAVCARPRVALLSTGDELVRPGESPGPDQIIASNAVGLAAQIELWGGVPVDLGLVPDREDAIRDALSRADGCDILVTIGGVSVGDHDLVRPVLESLGVEQSFWKIAMKPGKPLMAGRWGRRAVLGLPGNPVSALVTSFLFLGPLIRQAQGHSDPLPPLGHAPLGSDMKENGPRQDFVRAAFDQDGALAPLPVQDSAHLTGLARADALLIRPPHAPAAKTGERVPFHRLSPA